MNLTQGIKMAWKSISTNKMRSFLTMLGIIIGVSAVIALVSVGQGTTLQVQKQVASLGTNLLTVNITGRGALTALTYEEAMAYKELDGVQAVSPVISGRVTAKSGNENVQVSLEGITPDYETVRDFHVQAGRFLTDLDVDYRQRVALIGTTTVENLKMANPVGQTIYLNGQSYKIVGLLAVKGTSIGGSNDDKILIPITSAERLLKSKGVRSIYLQAKSPEAVSTVKSSLEESLQKKFRGTTNAYTVFDQQEMLSTVSSISNTLSLALGGIASISLLVGGIGIMNIMLVSVSERTREIGIRKAIGARKKDILLQFLVESMVLGGMGGLVGIALGVGGSGLAGKFTSLSISISWKVAILSFLFSLCIGVFFGLFPANKAAKLKPIEALRTE